MRFGVPEMQLFVARRAPHPRGRGRHCEILGRTLARKVRLAVLGARGLRTVLGGAEHADLASEARRDVRPEASIASRDVRLDGCAALLDGRRDGLDAGVQLGLERLRGLWDRATSCMPCGASPCATPRMAPSLRAAFDDARIFSAVNSCSCFEVLAELPAALPGAEPKASQATTSAAKFSWKEGSTRAKASLSACADMSTRYAATSFAMRSIVL